jgi:uncharacterized repeat protein (TIGR01451 family)
MKTHQKLAAAALLTVSTFGATSAPALAVEQTVVLKGEILQEKVTTNEVGETLIELVEPGIIVPGDRLVLGTIYTNTSSAPVNNFVVTNPLPTAVRLAPDADPNLELSVDGGVTWGRLANLTVAEEDDSPRNAKHSDVTHVRWTLPSVGPGESGRVEYSAIIL